ncbi:hypothetical protein OS493_013855 [Desmophyllum pertusum]|uniref:VWFA domain-containing protein n=1 Tax=Desmophyllum pertusum TaxID=174260 RepID=A0A9W9ZQA0_9CNID|nr:hypothetical protein OS493_013855 [Desmophyllum pertusum]
MSKNYPAGTQGLFNDLPDSKKKAFICEIPNVGGIGVSGGVKPGTVGAGCDLAIMVDASSSIIGKSNFQRVMNFVTGVFQSFTLGRGVRYGLVVFGSSAKVVFGFNQYNSIQDVDAEIAKVAWIGGTCNAGAAILECKASLFLVVQEGETVSYLY